MVSYFEFLRQFIHPGALVFDIGAHFGEETLDFLRLGARVVAIEPQAAAMGRLMSNCLSADGIDCANLTPLCVACGAENGHATMTEYGKFMLASFAPEKWNESRMRFSDPTGTREIPTVTLDALIDEYGVPVFTKIDVDYYEPEVIRGLSRPLPLLSYEYTREYVEDGIQVAHYLMSLGDYEFAPGIGRVAPDNVWSNEIDAIFAALIEDEDPLMWGDMYARLRS